MTTDAAHTSLWLELTRIQILTDLFNGLIDRKTADEALEALAVRREL